MGAQTSQMSEPLAISSLGVESDELRSLVARLLAAERRFQHCVTGGVNSRDSEISPLTSGIDEALVSINHGHRRHYLEGGSDSGEAIGPTNYPRPNGLECSTGLGVAEQLNLLVLSSALGGSPARSLSLRASIASEAACSSSPSSSVAAALLREASELAALRPPPDHHYRAALVISLHGRLAAHRQASRTTRIESSAGALEHFQSKHDDGFLWARGAAQPDALAAAADAIAQTSAALVTASQKSPNSLDNSSSSSSSTDNAAAQFTAGSGALPLSVALGVRLFFRLLKSLQRAGHVHGLLRIAEQLPQLLGPLPPAVLATPYTPSALMLRPPLIPKKGGVTSSRRPVLALEAPTNGQSSGSSNEEEISSENDRAVVDSLWAAVEELCALDGSVLGAEQHSATLAALLALAVKRAQLPPLLRAAQLLLFGAQATTAAAPGYFNSPKREKMSLGTGGTSAASQALHQFGGNNKTNSSSGVRSSGNPGSEGGGEGSSGSGGGGGGSLHGSSLNVRRYATKKMSPEVSAHANRIALAGGRNNNGPLGSSSARRTGSTASTAASNAPGGAIIPQPPTAVSTPGVSSTKFEPEELGWSPTGSLTSSRAGSAERAGDWSGERADLSSAGSVDYLEDSFGDEVTLLGRGMGDFKQDDDDDENDDEGHGGGGGGGYVEGERNRSRGTNSKSSANVTVKRDAKGELDDGFDDEDDEDSDSENDEMPFFGLSMGDAWDDTGDYNNKQSNLSNNLAAGETALPKNILKAVGSALQELSHLASTVPTLPWLDWADAPPLPSHDAVSSGAWAPWAEPAELGQPGQAQGGSGFLMTFGKGDHGKLGHGWGPLPVSTSSSAVKAMSATGAGPDQAAPPNLNAPAAVRALAGVPLSHVASLSTHSACVTASGALLTWGNGDKHRLGHGGPAAPEALPRLVRGLRGGLAPVSGLACGLGHTIALLLDGTMYTWGHGGNGRLGHGDLRDRTVPTRVAALQHPLLDDNEGKSSRGINECGYDAQNEKPPPEASANATATKAVRIVAVFAGASHSVAVNKQGCVWTWGKNNQGQCGVNSTDDVLLPTLVPFLTSQKVSTELTSNSSSFNNDCIGGSGGGAIREGNDDSASLPLAAGRMSGMASIATPARSRHGVVSVATPNEHRGLGSAAPSTAELSASSDATTGNLHSTGADGVAAPSAAAAAAAATAANASSPSGFAARRRSLVAAASSVTPGSHRQGANASGENNDGETDESAFDRLLASPTTRSPGSSYLRQSMGLPSSSPSSSSDVGLATSAAGAASSTEGASAAENGVDSGFGFEAGQQQVNDALENAANAGSIGDTTSKANDVKPTAAADNLNSEVAAVVSAAGGWEHTLFVLADGSVWSCGGGYKDVPPVLGLGAAHSGSSVLVPTRVPVLGSFTGSSKGASGGAFAANAGSHLGVPHKVSQSPPGNQDVPVANSDRAPPRSSNDHTNLAQPPEVDLRCVAVACGWDHSLAVTRHGQLFTWGAGQYGKLGHGDEEPRDVPTLVASLARGVSGSSGSAVSSSSSGGGGVRVTLAAAGCEHSACVDSDGGLWTWGHDDAGRLGHGVHRRRDGDVPDPLESDSALRPPMATRSSSAAVAGAAATVAAAPTSLLGAGSDEARVAPNEAAARAAVTLPRRVASLAEQGLRVVSLAVGDKYNMLLVRPCADEVDGEGAAPGAAPAPPLATSAVAGSATVAAANASRSPLSSPHLCTGAWLRAQAPLQLATSPLQGQPFNQGIGFGSSPSSPAMGRQQAALVVLAQLERVASKQLLSLPNLTPAHLKTVVEKAARTAVTSVTPSKDFVKRTGASSSVFDHDTQRLPLPLPPSWPLVLDVSSETFDLLLVLLRCALSESQDPKVPTTTAVAAPPATKSMSATPMATATNNHSASSIGGSSTTNGGSGVSGRGNRGNARTASPARASGASPARRVQTAMRLSPSKATVASSSPSTTANAGTSPGGDAMNITARRSKTSSSSVDHASQVAGNRSKFEASSLIHLAANSLSVMASWDGSTLDNPAAGTSPGASVGGAADPAVSSAAPAPLRRTSSASLLPATAADLNPRFVAWASLFTGLRLLRANTRHLVLLADATAAAAEQLAHSGSNIGNSNNEDSNHSAKINANKSLNATNEETGGLSSTRAELEANSSDEDIAKHSNLSHDGGSAAAAEVPASITISTRDNGANGVEDDTDEAAVQEAIFASLQAPPRPKRLAYLSNSSSSGDGGRDAQSALPSAQHNGTSSLAGKAKVPARPLNAVLADLHALLQALLRNGSLLSSGSIPSAAPSTPAVSPQASSSSSASGSTGGLVDRSGAKNPRSRSKSTNPRSPSPSPSSSSSLPANLANTERSRGSSGGGSSSRGSSSVPSSQRQRGPPHPVGVAAVAALQNEAVLCIAEAFPLLYPSPSVRVRLLRTLVAHLAPDSQTKSARNDTKAAPTAAPSSSISGSTPSNSRPGSRTSTASSTSSPPTPSSSREGGSRSGLRGGAAAPVQSKGELSDLPLNCAALVSALTSEVLREDRFAPLMATAFASSLEVSSTTSTPANGGAASAAGEELNVADVEYMLDNLTARCQADLKVEISTLRESLPGSPSGKGATTVVTPSAAAAAAAATAMTMLPSGTGVPAARGSSMSSAHDAQLSKSSPGEDALAVLVALQTHSLSVWASARANTSVEYSIEPTEEVALAQIERALTAARRSVDEVLSLLTKQQQAQQKQEQPPPQRQPAETPPLSSGGAYTDSPQKGDELDASALSPSQHLCAHVAAVLKRHLWSGALGALVSSLLALTVNSDVMPHKDSVPAAAAAASEGDRSNHAGTQNNMSKARRFAVSAAAARALPLLLPLLRDLDLVISTMRALCTSQQPTVESNPRPMPANSASVVPEWLLELQASLTATAARLTVAALVQGPPPSPEEEMVAGANAPEPGPLRGDTHESSDVSNASNASGTAALDLSLLPLEWHSLVGALEWQQRGVYLGGGNSSSGSSVIGGGRTTSTARGLAPTPFVAPAAPAPAAIADAAENLSRARRVVATQSIYRAELRRVGLEMLRHLLLAGSTSSSNHNNMSKGVLGPTTRVARELALAFAVLSPRNLPASTPASAASSGPTSVQSNRGPKASLPGSLPLQHVLGGLHEAPPASRASVLHTTGALLGALAHLLRRNTFSEAAPLSAPVSTQGVGIASESLSSLDSSGIASALVNSSDIAALSFHVEVLQACTALIGPLAASAAHGLRPTMGRAVSSAKESTIGTSTIKDASTHLELVPRSFSRDEALLVFEAAATSGLAPLLSGLLANPQTSPMHVAMHLPSSDSNEVLQGTQPPPDILVASALMETAVPNLPEAAASAASTNPQSTNSSSSSCSSGGSSSFWQVRLGAWEASAAEARAARAAALVPLQSWHASLRRRLGLLSGSTCSSSGSNSGCSDGATALGIDLRELGVHLAAEPSPPSRHSCRPNHDANVAAKTSSTEQLLPHFTPASTALELDCLRLAAHNGASHLLFLLSTHATVAATALADASPITSSEPSTAQSNNETTENRNAAAPAAALPAPGEEDTPRFPAGAEHVDLTNKLEQQLAHLNDACFSALYQELCRCKETLIALQQQHRARHLSLTRMAGVVLQAKPAVLPPLRLQPSHTAPTAAAKVSGSGGMPHVEPRACGEGAEGVHGFAVSFFVWIAPEPPSSRSCISTSKPAANASSATLPSPFLSSGSSSSHGNSHLIQPAVTVLASRPTTQSAPSAERLLTKSSGKSSEAVHGSTQTNVSDEVDNEVSLWASPHAGSQPCVRLVTGPGGHGALHVEVSVLALAVRQGGTNSGGSAANHVGTGDLYNHSAENSDHLEPFSPKVSAPRRRSANNNNQESSDEELESAPAHRHDDNDACSSDIHGEGGGGGGGRNNTFGGGQRLRAVVELRRLTSSRRLPTGRWVQVCCSLDSRTAPLLLRANANEGSSSTSGSSSSRDCVLSGGALRIFVDGEPDSEAYIAAPAPPGRGCLWLAPRDKSEHSGGEGHQSEHTKKNDSSREERNGIASETNRNGNDNNTAVLSGASLSLAWPPVVADVTWYAAPVSATSARMLATTRTEASGNASRNSLAMPSSVERSCQQAAEHYNLHLVAGLSHLATDHTQTSTTTRPIGLGCSSSNSSNNISNGSHENTVLARLCSPDWLQLMVALLPISGTAPQALLFRLLTAVLTAQPLSRNFSFQEENSILGNSSSSNGSSSALTTAQGALLRSLFKLLTSASFAPSPDGLSAAERRVLAERDLRGYEVSNNKAGTKAATTPTRESRESLLMTDKWSTTPGSLSDDGDDDEGILPSGSTTSQDVSVDYLDVSALNARGLGDGSLGSDLGGHEFDDNASRDVGSKDANTASRPMSECEQGSSFATLPPFALGRTFVHPIMHGGRSLSSSAVMGGSLSPSGAFTTAGDAAAFMLSGDYATSSAGAINHNHRHNNASTVRGIVRLLQALLSNPSWQATTAAALTRGLELGVPRHLLTVTPNGDVRLDRGSTQARTITSVPQASPVSTTTYQDPAPAEGQPLADPQSSEQHPAGTLAAPWRGADADPRVALFSAQSDLPAGLAALELLGIAQDQSWAIGDTVLIAAGVCFDAPLPLNEVLIDAKKEDHLPSVQRLSQSTVASVVQVLPTWPISGAVGLSAGAATGAALVLLSPAATSSLTPIIEASALRSQQDLFRSQETANNKTLVSTDPLPALRGVMFAPHVAGDLVASTGGLLVLVPFPLLQPVPLQFTFVPTASFAHRSLPPALACFLAHGLDHELSVSRTLSLSESEANTLASKKSSKSSSNCSTETSSDSAMRIAAKLADEQLAYDALLLSCRTRALVLRATTSAIASASATDIPAETAASTFLDAGLLPALLPLAGASLDALPPVALGADAWQVAKHLPAVGRLAAWLAQGVDTSSSSSSRSCDTADVSDGLAALEQCASTAWRRLTALPPDAFARSPWCRDHARSLPGLAEQLQRRTASLANRRGRLALRRLLSSLEAENSDTRTDDGHDSDDDADATAAAAATGADGDHGVGFPNAALEPPRPRIGFEGAARQRVLAELDPRNHRGGATTNNNDGNTNGNGNSRSNSNVDAAVAAWFPCGWSARAPVSLLPHSGFSLSPNSSGAADPPLAVTATSLAAAEAAAAKQHLEVFRSSSSLGRSGGGALEGQLPAPEDQLAAVDGWRMRALSAFPTVRLSGCALAVGEGQWYYEAVLLTDGLMQIGWAADVAPPDGLLSSSSSSLSTANPSSSATQRMQTSLGGAGAGMTMPPAPTATAAAGAATAAAEGGSFACDPLDGTGCGDHTKSWAYDGLRQRRWSVASSPYGERWRMGDVLG